MSALKDELARSSNEMLEMVSELKDLERRKREQPISSPAFHELAEQVTDKTRDIMRSVIKQEDLGNQTERGSVSIDDVDEGDVDR